MAGPPITGEPVGVSGFGSSADQVLDGKEGPFYNNRVHKTLIDKGVWSDGMLDVFNNPSPQDTAIDMFLVCCCPCVIFYKMLEKTGKVETPYIGALDNMKYGKIFACMSIVYIIISVLKIPPNIMCKPVDEVHHMRDYHPSQVAQHYRNLAGMDELNGASTSIAAAAPEDPTAVLGSAGDAASAAPYTPLASMSGLAQGASPATVAPTPAPQPSGGSGGDFGLPSESADVAATAQTTAQQMPGQAKKKIGQVEAAADAHMDEMQNGVTDHAEEVESKLPSKADSTKLKAGVAAAAQQITDGIADMRQANQTRPMAIPMDGAATKPKAPKMKCTNVWEFILDILMRWLFPFVIFKGIKKKLNVQEDDKVTCLKSPCLPELCFACCQCCYLMQVRRHVDRVQGYMKVEDDRINLQGNDRLNSEGF